MSMEKIRPTISDCCKAKIESRPSPYDNGEDYDYCSACNNPISYGLVGWFHDESMAVCRLYDDTLWFFWQQTSSWNFVANHHQEYIGQIKSVVDSVDDGESDPDMLPYSAHKLFSNKYKGKVQNPQWAL